MPNAVGPTAPTHAFVAARPYGVIVACMVIVAAASIPGYSSYSAEIYWQVRLPRTMLAAATGAGLALGGVMFQTLFRNPLAEPYTLGVASGASLGVAVTLLLGLPGLLHGVPLRLTAALGGAAAALLLVYLMSRLRGGHDLTRLLLAGVCVSYFSSAGILLVTYLAGRAVNNDIVIWLMGSLSPIGWAAPRQIAAAFALVLVFALLRRRDLDLLAIGDEWAAARGVPVQAMIWGGFAATGALTAVIVAHCGPIGFVGLMAPHFARLVSGARALPLLITASALGAAFLATCDALARSISAYELPVGVMTNTLGAAFFFYLLTRRPA